MKKILVAVAIAALTMGSMTAADARIGSSSSSSSRSSSSSFSRSSPSGISSGSSSRIGGSMGVSNSNVMAAARAQTQTSRSFGNVSANTSAARTVTTTSQTTTRSNSYYNNGGVRSGGYYGGGSPGYYPHPGYSGGTVAAAAVAGAVGGAMLANSGNHGGTTIINNGGVGGGVPVYGNGGAVYENGGGVAVAAVPVAPATTVYVEHHSGIWTFLGWVVAIVLLFFLVRWIIRLMSSSTSNAIYEGPGDYASSSTTTRTTRTTTTTVDPEEERAINKAKQLLGSAPQFYRQLQNANNRGDKDALRAMMTPQMFAEVEAGINERDGKPGQTTVKELRVVRDEVLQMRLEGDVYRGSIHFKGVVNEGDGQPDEAFDEVHHFYAEGVSAPWKLEGIESV